MVRALSNLLDVAQSAVGTNVTLGDAIRICCLIRGYQLAISPLLPASCRYLNQLAYALEAFERRGVMGIGPL